MEWFTQSPLPVLAFKDNHGTALPVPPGKRIDVSECVEDDRFAVVRVDGEEFHAFVDDIRLQCRPVPSRTPRRRTAA